MIRAWSHHNRISQEEGGSEQFCLPNCKSKQLCVEIPVENFCRQTHFTWIVKGMSKFMAHHSSNFSKVDNPVRN